MKNLLLYASLFLTVSVSCKHSDVEPAQSIEGTYQAKGYYDRSTGAGNAIAYPINGQELTLQIKYVSKDTVSVQLIPSTSSSPNGVYSPTQTLSYPKAYIESPSNAATTYIYLTGKPGGPISTTNTQIWIYKDKQMADYVFTPQQTPTFPKSIRFEKNSM